MTGEDVTALAEAIRCHVPAQPYGVYGHEPVPVDIQWAGDAWTVRYVRSVRGKRRVWAEVQGPSLGAALRLARADQLGQTGTSDGDGDQEDGQSRHLAA